MQHLRVLIADDEMIIREGIKDAVEWGTIRLEVVAEAEDGEEALELALEHKVHILLADLNMPIMNGLTLIKNIREQLPQCKIIIITGHDEFSYAQEAIRLGVVDYIMKPVNPEELQKVLAHVSTELRLEESEKADFDMASIQITKNIPLLRERFCQDWLEGNRTDEEVLEQLKFLKLPSSTPNVIGIIRWLEMNTKQPLMTESDLQQMLLSIEGIVRKMLQEHKKVIFRDQAGLIIVFVWGEVPEEIFNEIEISIQNDLKVKIIQHFEKVTGKINDISDNYQCCKSKVFHKTDVSQIVRQAEQYINQHFNNKDLSSETVARELQLSSIYLSRMIKQDLGISFINLLTKKRIKKAIELLNSTNLTINEISEKVGYDTQHYFSTSFKKVMGIPPNRYRKGNAFSNKRNDV